MTGISKEENSEDFCLDFVQEFGLWREVVSKKKGWGEGEVLHSHWNDLGGGGSIRVFYCSAEDGKKEREDMGGRIEYYQSWNTSL